MEQVEELSLLIKRFTRDVTITMEGFDVSIPLSVLAPDNPLLDSSAVFGIIWRKENMELFIHPKDGITNSENILHSIQEKCKHKKSLGSVLQIAVAEFRGEMTPDSTVPSKTSTPNYFLLKQRRASPPDSGTDSFSSGSGEPICYSRLDDDYEWLADLGEGGKGSVYLYLHKVSGMKQAVKVIFGLENEDEILQNEVKALCHVQHQNVVRFYDAWIQNMVIRPDPDFSKTDVRNMLCISMEVCPSSLDKQLEKCAKEHKDFSAQEVEKLFMEIATGLAYIHARGICHRDLSPHNIFIDENGVIKIGDFGSAIILADGKSTFKLDCPKKHLYVAPESLSGDEVDNKVDSFSFGLILFEVLHPCMERKEIMKTFNEAREGIIPKDCLATRLGKVVASLLEKDPKKRSSVEEAIGKYYLLAEAD